jgi:hypothetical protein
MLDKIFDLLSTNPLITIVGAIAIIIVFMLLFKTQIAQYLTKKFDLYSKDDMKAFANYTLDNAQKLQKTFKRDDSGIFKQSPKPLIEVLLKEWVDNKINK